MAEAGTVPADQTATGAPAAEAKPATQVLAIAVATKCIVQTCGLFAVFLDVP